MNHLLPLPLINPEFSVTEFPGYRQYKVENWHLARDGSGRVVKGTSRVGWFFAFLVLCIAYAWTQGLSLLWLIGGALVVSPIVWLQCTQVLSESVILIPLHGIQFETERGFPSFPLSTQRSFIPFGALHDVVVNEGLTGWQVRYYIVAIKKASSGRFSLTVAYKNILPYHPVLLHVYHGIHEFLIMSRGQER